MAQVNIKRGTQAQLNNEPLKDGLLAFTTDDGRIHIDYINDQNEIVRKTLYSGKLIIGNHVYDGTEDVTVAIYDGDVVD